MHEAHASRLRGTPARSWVMCGVSDVKRDRNKAQVAGTALSRRHTRRAAGAGAPARPARGGGAGGPSRTVAPMVLQSRRVGLQGCKFTRKQTPVRHSSGTASVTLNYQPPERLYTPAPQA
eukprot:scaffold48264_cov58-Phaeocystis_antarctica.AAC.2